MSQIESLKRICETTFDAPHHTVCQTVWNAMRDNGNLDLGALCELPYPEFEVIVGALKEWRLQRYVYAADRVANPGV